MISGANDEELDIANIRADFLLEIQHLQQELQRKDNNWNELKKYVMSCYIVGHKVQNGSLDMIINKMKELENGQSND